MGQSPSLFVSISPARTPEGQSGTQTLQVPLFLSAPSGTPVTVTWAANGGTAEAGSDFSPAAGTVTFAPGEIRQTIPLLIQGDTQDEYDETIELQLSSPTGALLGKAEAVAKIENDEKRTMVSFPTEVPLYEKDPRPSASPTLTIYNPQPGRTVNVLSGRASDTANPGEDFTSTTGVLELSATAVPLGVQITDDTLVEPAETFSINLSNPGPCVAILPKNSNQTFPPIPVPGSVALEDDVMAAGGPDGLHIYLRLAGQWSHNAFMPAPAGGVFSVAVDHGLVAADFADSGVRIFVRDGLGNWVEESLIPRGAAAVDSRRVLALQDDTLLIGDPAAAGQSAVSGEVRIHERHAGGPSGWGLASILSPTTTQPDFGSRVALYGLTLAVSSPGDYSISVLQRHPVTRACTKVVEHVVVMTDFGRSFALNADSLVMSIPGGFLTSRRLEAEGGTWSVPVQQLLLPNQNQVVRQVFFQKDLLWAYSPNFGMSAYTTGPTAAWAGLSGLSLPATPTPANRRLAFTDADVVITGTESDGTLPLMVYRDAVSVQTIIDDDDLLITIGDAVVNGGTATLPVTLSKSLPVNVSVDVVAVDGTATGGSDYNFVPITLQFSPGTTVAHLSVDITAPDPDEVAEQFQIRLQNPSLGAAGPNGRITIAPTFPRLSMTNFSYERAEGNSGPTTLEILVQLSAPAPANASFDWAVDNFTAQVGMDIAAGSGTVTVAAGATTASIPFIINGDLTPESQETLTVRLKNPKSLLLGTGSVCIVSISNDDIGIAAPDSYSIPQNTTLAGVNVRSNDTNVDSVQIGTFPQYGTLVSTAAGSIVYTPSPNFVGFDSFTYGNSYPLTGQPPVYTTVSISVTDGNMPPILKPDAYNAREETLLDVVAGLGLLENDGLWRTNQTPFNPILEKEILNVTNGTLTDFTGSTGLFKFMPAPNFSGVATFSYRVRDKDGWSLPAAVRITVADDLPLSPLARLQPFGSQLHRSFASSILLPTTGEADYFLPLKAGQTLSLRTGTTATLGTLAIRDSNGIALAGGIAGFNSLEHVPIPSDGTYQIAAGPRVGGSSGYFLAVVNGGAAPASSPSTSPYDLDAGQPAGSLRSAVVAAATGFNANYYTFSGTAGEKVKVYLKATPSKFFSIRTPAGTLLASSSVSPSDQGASAIEYTLAATGPHHIVVPGSSNAEYSLELIRSGRNAEFSTASLPLLENRGFGYLAGRGVPAPPSTGPVTTFATFADYGANSTGERDVAAMVKSWNPDFIAVGGDHNYATDYTIASPTWKTNVGNYYGSFMLGRADNRYPEQTSTIQRFFPAPGNHDSGPDFNNGGELSGYFDYLYSNPGGLPRLPAGVHQPMLEYYKMQWGNTEFYFLDSDNASVNAVALSVQRQWLKDQLAVSTAKWKFAVFHHAPYSSCGTHGSQAFMQWGKDFEGLTALFVGHDHTYERVDAGFGVTQFVVGLGGANPYQFSSSPLTNTLARYNAKNGALRVVAGTDGVLFEFRAIGQAGGELIDSYQIGTIDAGVVPSGTDTWSLRVQPGQVFRLTTRTPASPGTQTNDLDPVLSIHDASGALVETDRDSAADGRNASILCTVPALPGAPPEGVLWTVKIANNSSGSGEYELEVTTPDTAAYRTWADLIIANPASPTDRATQADPDLDGVPNLLEYLLATDPTVPNPESPLALTPPSGAAPAPPNGATPDPAQLLLRLPTNWTVPIIVQLQSSETLAPGSWITEAVKHPNSPWIAPPGLTPQPAPNGGGYTLPLPLNTPRRFHRLRLGWN